MSDYKTIAESKNFIVLDKYVKEWQANESYQSEYDLEREFIQDLQNQGYDYVHPGDENSALRLTKKKYFGIPDFKESEKINEKCQEKLDAEKAWEKFYDDFHQKENQEILKFMRDV